ncbi:MAG: IucA/IucC family C-terminal-domain containing protein [Egibacteraceae bacterium]
MNFSAPAPSVRPVETDHVARVAAPPLEATLARVSARSARWAVRIGWPAEPYWLEAATIRERLDGLMAAIGVRYRTTDQAVTGTFLLNTYVRAIVGPALASLATERRVPDVAPDNVAFRFGPDGIVQELALAAPRFAALPEDPDADHPDATILADVTALRGWLRERLLCGHLADLVPLLRARTRRGPRALWGTASDMCSGVFAILAEAEGSVKAAEELDAESRAFLATGPPLLVGPPLCPVMHAGGMAAGRQRLTCCLAYRLPDYEMCTSCPGVHPAERERRLRAQLERHEEL